LPSDPTTDASKASILDRRLLAYVLAFRGATWVGRVVAAAAAMEEDEYFCLQLKRGA